MNDGYEISIKEEINDVSMGKPHVLLLGAGASKAALPDGDRNGKPIPVLKDLAKDLRLQDYFPSDLKALSESDFELAYSQLFDRGQSKELEKMSEIIMTYLLDLELPDQVNLYDILHLTLRKKDIIATFNWDPFLMLSRTRLAKLGVNKFPKLFFLHGNVAVGYCEKDKISGLVGNKCSKCSHYFKPSKLLYPIEHKNYQDDPFIKREWEAIRYFLKNCFMLTVFGYSAPKTDVEAIKLLKEGWGDVESRDMEQTEIISHSYSDHDALRKTWSDFIHTHHYEIHNSFFESFICNHPRRSGEAYWNQYYEAKFISNNTVPNKIENLKELVEWFKPLLDAEEKLETANVK